MATRRRKSLDDIRKQTDRIYKLVLDRYSDGTISKERYNKLLDKTIGAERKYSANIKKQSRFKNENAQNWRTASATKYSRRAYMTGSNG